MRAQSFQSVFVLCLIVAATASCGSERHGEPDYDAYGEGEELCTTENERITELEEQLEEARAQLAVLEDRKDQLQSAAQDLQFNVDRLASENWRDVVPDIDASADEVEYESSEMEDELYEAESALDER